MGAILWSVNKGTFGGFIHGSEETEILFSIDTLPVLIKWHLSSKILKHVDVTTRNVLMRDLGFHGVHPN